MSVQRGGRGDFRYCFYHCPCTGFEIYDLEGAPQEEQIPSDGCWWFSRYIFGQKLFKSPGKWCRCQLIRRIVAMLFKKFMDIDGRSPNLFSSYHTLNFTGFSEHGDQITLRQLSRRPLWETLIWNFLILKYMNISLCMYEYLNNSLNI